MRETLVDYLRGARQRTLDAYPSASNFANKYYSGCTYALWKVAHPVTGAVSGLVLDAGSGRGGWKDIILKAGAVRETVDIEPREDLTWTADLEAMPQVPDARYDAVVCHQVLEHVPDPGSALSEIFRVLKPGGLLILSVPHLSRLHELPHDYFRYTPNGMRAVLERSGFEVSQIAPYGGLLTFVHHQAATVVLGLAAIWRPLFLAAVAFNAPFSVLSSGLDRLIDRSALMPNGIVVTSSKPPPRNGE
ncbi:MAG: class I SAM-dependent methyltransferase [Caulobacteraceae bacterium]